MNRLLFLFLSILSTSLTKLKAFTPTVHQRTCATTPKSTQRQFTRAPQQQHFSSNLVPSLGRHGCRSYEDDKKNIVALRMAGNEPGEEGPSPLTAIGLVLVAVLFLGGTFLPLFQLDGPDLTIADSVVTRQDTTMTLLQGKEASNFKLSRASIQEKLSAIPVFYITSGNDAMYTDIYLSYSEAKEAATSKSTVKATSLDQVMYPLVLKRGRMRMAPPPSEVQAAEAELNSEGSTKKYRLIPSKAAIEQAKALNMVLADSDVPLFVADRLAFSGPKGPQLPLFVDQKDCVYSYRRLRSSKTSLPEQPNVRSTSLFDELESMEKGSRPGVGQLAFYATSDDVQVAADMLQ